MHLALLLLTLAALLAGPALYVIARQRPALLAFLDGFVLVSISGLVLIDVLPDAFRAGGYGVIAFVLLGLLGPTLLERVLTHARREAHLLTLALAILGLMLHSFGDGAALSPAGGDSHGTLALAIAIHSVPVGLAVWWLLFPVFGAWLPALAIAAMCASTALGYGYGVSLNLLLGDEVWAWFQALIAGSILHVVFGRPHLDDHDHAQQQQAAPPYEGLGNLAALLVLALMLSTLHEHTSLLAFGARALDLALESAPALLLAYLIGGWISGELPESWLRWIGRGGSASQALRGMAVGLPLPICSCGVLPLYQSLIQRGMPQAAALAFLIATPEVGLTALFVSIPLLGADATLVRVGAAAVLAVLVAYLLTRGWPQPLRVTAPVPACCAHDHGHDHAAAAQAPRWRRALRSGLVDLVDDTAAWIVAGIALAAAILPYAQSVLWAELPNGLEVVIFALLGMPMYVCAAGATPLVAVLIAAGVSPGAAIAFLLTGPATNVATFGVLSRLHGRRLALAFAGVTAAGAIALGWLVDLALPGGLATPVAAAHDAHHGLFAQLCLAALLLLYTGSLLRKGGRGLLNDLTDPGAAYAR